MPLASYATDPAASRGRQHHEKECAMRTPHQRDRDRIIHSAAFRRLEYKTQVFVNHEGDHYRTRLTHSLEVAQLARSLARMLQVNEDLTEAVALAHDLGHPPFGHAGEDGLSEAMQAYGGFNHNAQTLKILTRIEHRYADFDGLNLTWETLEGVAKHNGPLQGPYAQRKAPADIAAFSAIYDLELHTFPGIEAQIAALADDIAYNNHDLEDGIRAHLFTLDDLAQVPMMREIIQATDEKYGKLDPKRRIHEVIRRAINRMVADVYNQTRQNLVKNRVDSATAVRHLGQSVVSFSPEMEASNKILKTFLFENMYRHYKVNRMASKARRLVKELFLFYHGEPDCLPTEWRHVAEGSDESASAHLVADFIAGMTDRYAMDEHQRAFDMRALG